MQRPVPGVMVTLLLVLVMPVAAAAQAPTTDALVLQDATGDLHDLATGEPVVGPGYTDLTGMEVRVYGNRMLLRFDVAEDVPEAPDPLSMTVDYLAIVDIDGDDEPDYHVAVTSAGGWAVEVFDYATATSTRLDGGAAIEGGSLSRSILQADVGSPSEMRFQGRMTASAGVDPSVEASLPVAWEDRVSDGADEWWALGESNVEPIVVVTAADVVAGLTAKTRKKDLEKVSLDSIERRLQRLWKRHGDELSAVTLASRSGPVTANEFIGQIPWMRRGFVDERDRRAGPVELLYSRVGHAAGLAGDLLTAYDQVDDPGLKAELVALATAARNYAVLGVQASKWRYWMRSFDDDLRAAAADHLN